MAKLYKLPLNPLYYKLISYVTRNHSLGLRKSFVNVNSGNLQNVFNSFL